MLDAYIINRIRREREAERDRSTLIPLRIHVPDQRPAPHQEKERKRDDVDDPTVVDFQL